MASYRKCYYVSISTGCHNESFFFSILVFFHEHSRLTWQQGKGKGICLTPLYHFHTLHRQLDISQVITAESSPLYIASIVAGPEMGTFARKSLTNRLRELQTDHSKITFVQSGCYVQQFGFVVFIFRSSHQRCSLKKIVLKNSAKFTGKHLCWRLFLALILFLVE